MIMSMKLAVKVYYQKRNLVIMKWNLVEMWYIVIMNRVQIWK